MMFDEKKRREEINNTDCRFYGWQDFITQIISQEKSMIEQAVEKENEKAFRVLAGYGVPKERAKSVSNGIQVLVTRMEKEIDELIKEKCIYITNGGSDIIQYFDKDEYLKVIAQAKKEARKEFADKIRIETGRLKSMNTFKNIDEFYDLIDNLLKEYEEGFIPSD
jgi:uncharacterized protein (DUF1697 family)